MVQPGGQEVLEDRWKIEKVFDNKSLKLSNFNNFVPIFKIQTATGF